MPTYEVTGPDGRTAIIEAPQGVAREEAVAFAQENWAGWRDGGRYAMEPVEQALAAGVATTGASQAAVRATEPPETPGARQTRAERDFETAMQAWRVATGGAIKPHQVDVRQAAAEWSGLQDPRETAQAADIEHLRETGELTPSTSLQYALGKGLATAAGFATGGPAGATGAGGLVDVVVLSTRLNEGVQAGAITEDQAASIMLAELTKRVGTDAVLNFGLPMLGQALSRVPGAQWLGRKVVDLARKGAAVATKGVQGPLVPKGVTGEADEAIDILARETRAAREVPERGARAPLELPAGSEARRARLAQTAPDDATREAIGELGTRAPDVMPTPAQLTGHATRREARARSVSPVAFEQARETLEGATESARQQLVRTGQTRERFGDEIMVIADDTMKAVKERLRPVFQRGDEAGVGVDVTPMVAQIDGALKRGFALTEAERGRLTQLRDMISPPAAAGSMVPHPAFLGPMETQDLLSSLKANLRNLNVDGKPSPVFSKLVGDITRAGEHAFEASLVKAGKSGLAGELRKARSDYRRAIETVFDDTLVKAAKRDPEAVGKLLWGGTSRVQDTNKVLALAVREGRLNAGQFQELRGKLAKGFLDDTARDVSKLAKWTETLNADTAKRETWEALTRGRGGAELRNAMKVLEKMAQISTRGGTTAGKDVVPMPHAGGRAISAVTGLNQPGFATFAAGLNKYNQWLAAAYTTGEKGIINNIALALSPKSAGTAARYTALGEIGEWAVKNGLDKLDEDEDGTE